MTPQQLVDLLNDLTEDEDIPSVEVSPTEFTPAGLRKLVYINRFYVDGLPLARAVGRPIFSLTPLTGSKAGGEYDRSAKTWRYDGHPVQFSCHGQPVAFFLD